MDRWRIRKDGVTIYDWQTSGRKLVCSNKKDAKVILKLVNSLAESIDACCNMAREIDEYGSKMVSEESINQCRKVLKGVDMCLEALGIPI